ncbi:CLUMA_CG018432, isoform A [Clunio marinus]|uniref:CLUMA_CG018432, isoform A n=1 Tax=Clunio marinus TaxID=568069 RepID=A0A1J1J147_9DIPT|nr:CLUMA_CG018432, isoform A [Clunio marinus]
MGIENSSPSASNGLAMFSECDGKIFQWNHTRINKTFGVMLLMMKNQPLRIDKHSANVSKLFTEKTEM